MVRGDEQIESKVEKSILQQLDDLPEAVTLYNELCCKSDNVGALIHSTC